MINPENYFDYYYIEPDSNFEVNLFSELQLRPLTSYEISKKLNLSIPSILNRLNKLWSDQKIIRIDNGIFFYKIKKEKTPDDTEEESGRHSDRGKDSKSKKKEPKTPEEN